MKRILAFILILTAGVFVACGATKPTSIEISDAPSSIDIGQSVKLTAVVLPAKASQEVKWATTDSTIASIDDSGNVTGVKHGVVIITASAKGDDDVKATASITVNAYKAESIAITSTETTVTKGVPFKFYAAVSPAGANQAVKWSIVTEGYTGDADVTETGGTVTGLAIGTVKLVATSVADPTKTASKEITIEYAAVQSVVLTDLYENGYLITGDVVTLNISILPAGADQTYTVTSEDSAIVEVSEGNKITAKAVGTAVIHINSSAEGIKKDVEIHVINPETLVNTYITSLGNNHKFTGSQLKLYVTPYAVVGDLVGATWSYPAGYFKGTTNAAYNDQYVDLSYQSSFLERSIKLIQTASGKTPSSEVIASYNYSAAAAISPIDNVHGGYKYTSGALITLLSKYSLKTYIRVEFQISNGAVSNTIKAIRLSAVAGHETDEIVDTYTVSTDPVTELAYLNSLTTLTEDLGTNKIIGGIEQIQTIFSLFEIPALLVPSLHLENFHSFSSGLLENPTRIGTKLYDKFSFEVAGLSADTYLPQFSINENGPLENTKYIAEVNGTKYYLGSASNEVIIRIEKSLPKVFPTAVIENIAGLPVYAINGAAGFYSNSNSQVTVILEENDSALVTSIQQSYKAALASAGWADTITNKGVQFVNPQGTKTFKYTNYDSNEKSFNIVFENSGLVGKNEWPAAAIDAFYGNLEDGPKATKIADIAILPTSAEYLLSFGGYNLNVSFIEDGSTQYEAIIAQYKGKAAEIGYTVTYTKDGIVLLSKHKDQKIEFEWEAVNNTLRIMFQEISAPVELDSIWPSDDLETKFPSASGLPVYPELAATEGQEVKYLGVVDWSEFNITIINNKINESNVATSINQYVNLLLNNGWNYVFKDPKDYGPVSYFNGDLRISILADGRHNRVFLKFYAAPEGNELVTESSYRYTSGSAFPTDKVTTLSSTFITPGDGNFFELPLAANKFSDKGIAFSFFTEDLDKDTYIGTLSGYTLKQGTTNVYEKDAVSIAFTDLTTGYVITYGINKANITSISATTDENLKLAIEIISYAIMNQRYAYSEVFPAINATGFDVTFGGSPAPLPGQERIKITVTGANPSARADFITYITSGIAENGRMTVGTQSEIEYYSRGGNNFWCPGKYDPRIIVTAEQNNSFIIYFWGW